MKLLDLKARAPIRRDMGIAGAIIILSQFVSNFQSSHTISKDFESLKSEFQQMKLERERFFVRKTDLAPVLTKLDHLNEKMTKLSEKFMSLRKIVQDERYEDASLQGAEGGDLVGCSTKPAVHPKGLKI